MSDDDVTTPVELPPIEAHVPLIKALGFAGLQLAGVSASMGELVRELRVAREPMGNTTRDKIASIGKSIMDAGAGIVRAFTPEKEGT